MPASEAVGWYAHSYNRAGFYRVAEALAWLPRGVRLALARQLGRAAHRLLAVERATVRDTLARVTGASGARLDALSVRLFGDFAMCFSDLLSTNRRAPARLARAIGGIVGAEQVERVRGGFVSVTAHVGNWELAGRLLATRSARRTHVVVTAEEAPALRRWMRRDGDGVRFVARSHPGVGVELVAALRRGEVVALQGDRAIGTRGDTVLPFFGAPAPFPLGPFILASAARVPVVPAFCVLGPGHRYTVRVEAPIAVERGEEAAAAQAWVAALEAVVRAHPTQWFNFYDIWRPVPDTPTC